MSRWRAASSWLIVCAMIALLAVLGVLQYRWIGEVSVASRDRLKGSLQASLNRLSQELNSEITSGCRAILPTEPQVDVEAAEREIAARYGQWRQSHRFVPLFSAIAVASFSDDQLTLRRLDLDTGFFAAAEWPAAWESTRTRVEARTSGEPWRNPHPLLLAPPDGNRVVLDIPVFPPGGPGRPPFRLRMPPPGDRGREFSRRHAWVIFDLNLPYVRETVLPELLRRHLAAGGDADYQAEVLTRANPPAVVFRSGPAGSEPIGKRADASVGLFEIQYEQFLRRRGGPDGPGTGPGGPMREMRLAGAGLARWVLHVRHRAGSLDAVVAQARLRNLAVTAGVLALMLASVAALVRFTRRAQRLAELQMEFVAGVSHELRTPLTVIHTAAYNLRGRLAANPAQVERYGALIQKESGRLKDLVEQVLGFAGARAGRVIQEPEPVSVESVIDETIEASKPLIEGRAIERSVEPGLPHLLGDRSALKQALQNLLSNAAKYGGDQNWIGISASRAGSDSRPLVEIRVADRGPGVPSEEQDQIFEPFFRGRRAVQEQIHGTGLGLNLVKKIIEAHGGTVRVKSEPGKGSEFIVLVPAVPQERT